MKKTLTIVLASTVLLSFASHARKIGMSKPVEELKHKTQKIGMPAPILKIPAFNQFLHMIAYPPNRAIFLYTFYNGKLYELKATPPKVFGLYMSRKPLGYKVVFRSFNPASAKVPFMKIKPPFMLDTYKRFFKGTFADGKRLPKPLLDAAMRKINRLKRKLRWPNVLRVK